MAARESSHGTTELRPTVPSLPAARASHAPESGKHRLQANDKLEAAALVGSFDQTLRDPLTHAYNRRHFDDQLRRELAFAERHDKPLSVLLVDVDHIKRVNDRFGHGVGDVVLKAVSASVQRVLRPGDLLSRIGGEEFVVVARDTTLRNAQILAERIRRRVETLPFEVGGQDFVVTVSIGVTSVGPDSGYASGERVVESADAAMYTAKLEGRNRISLAPTPHEDTHVSVKRTMLPAAADDTAPSADDPTPLAEVRVPVATRPPRV
jgi:diguanylate cyclase (GGDEF)-like protein